MEYGLRIAELEELRLYNLESFAIALEGDKHELRSWQLSEAYFNETGAEAKSGIAKELQHELDIIFDLRLKERRQEIEMLEAELNELKSIVNRREEMREKILKNRLNELLEPEDEALGWW